MDREKAMNDLEKRWFVEPLFRQLYALIFSPDVVPNGMDLRTWFMSVAPRTKHPLDPATLDLRGICLDGLHAGKEHLSGVIDGGSFRACVFEETGLQSASAAQCDFTGSHFLAAQMSPLYAPHATFKDCVFEHCFVQGWGERGLKDSEGNVLEGSYSDLRDCDFSGVRATQTCFECCDFRGARFVDAQFAQCQFDISDFRGANLERAQFTACEFPGALAHPVPGEAVRGIHRCDFRGARLIHAQFGECKLDRADFRATDLDGAQFITCDLTGARFDDNPEIRRLVQKGGNLAVETIEWIPTIPTIRKAT
jgi:uncharacterized protein YjbI with pentapeptide repeats